MLQTRVACLFANLSSTTPTFLMLKGSVIGCYQFHSSFKVTQENMERRNGNVKNVQRNMQFNPTVEPFFQETRHSWWRPGYFRSCQQTAKLWRNIQRIYL